MTPRPGSFHRDEQPDWALWVLDHGLPELPAQLAVDECVPVSRWLGPDIAAVTTVTRYVDDEGDEWVDDDTMFFLRSAHGWEQDGGSGGAGAPVVDDDAYASNRGVFGDRPLAPDQVVMEPSVWSGGRDWSAVAVIGLAGSNAAVGEVEQAGQVVRAPLEAPVGMFVIAFRGEQPAVVRVLDATGKILDAIQVGPTGPPSW